MESLHVLWHVHRDLEPGKDAFHRVPLVFRAEVTDAVERVLPVLKRGSWRAFTCFGTRVGTLNWRDAAAGAIASWRRSRHELEAERPPAKCRARHNRHSYISYRVAQTQNVAQTALEAGNTPKIIFSNYRELVKPADAVKWFGIEPEVPENVIQAPIENVA